jgi:two-component system, NarL family, response regulator LiaR
MKSTDIVSKPKTVVIAEDHVVTRMGLKIILDSYAQVNVIAEAGNGKQAVEFTEQLKPDVIVLDLSMPEMDGIEASRAIRQKSPGTKIIILTSSKDERDIFGALAAGANGYCTKEVGDDRLLLAILAVCEGDIWLDSSIAAKVLSVLPQPVPQSQAGTELSERERAVLSLIVEGLGNQEIGKRLFISADTVKSHVKHILEKLSVSDRTQAAVKALREGMV